MKLLTTLALALIATVGFAAASGDRNAASSAASRVFAVLRWASLTCPYPRMCSGTDAR